eukprot:comp20200_c0_seq1/m.39977 comp20200_c0_seq1/g.39977  ORF comp20200_c0_seq1/g.39977 comp20200_c0_seq1/m.39977 type:complete len:362 (-) comp20200_c0_seq1:396-1481(-)
METDELLSQWLLLGIRMQCVLNIFRDVFESRWLEVLNVFLRRLAINISSLRMMLLMASCGETAPSCSTQAQSSVILGIILSREVSLLSCWATSRTISIQPTAGSLTPWRPSRPTLTASASGATCPPRATWPHGAAPRFYQTAHSIFLHNTHSTTQPSAPWDPKSTRGDAEATTQAAQSPTLSRSHSSSPSQTRAQPQSRAMPSKSYSTQSRSSTTQNSISTADANTSHSTTAAHCSTGGSTRRQAASPAPLLSGSKSLPSPRAKHDTSPQTCQTHSSQIQTQTTSSRSSSTLTRSLEQQTQRATAQQDSRETRASWSSQTHRPSRAPLRSFQTEPEPRQHTSPWACPQAPTSHSQESPPQM